VPRFDARREYLEPLASVIWPAGGTAEPIQRVHRSPDNDGHCRFIEQDCHGNTFPTCGDCLWGRNIIVCP